MIPSRHVELASSLDQLRTIWIREVYAVATALRRNGRHRRLRDVTIVLPIDHVAIEAIELACVALSEGALFDSSGEMERFFDQVVTDPFAADRFLGSVRGVARRVGTLR